MLQQNYGKIINIGSFHCQVTMNGVPRSGYSTAKGAVNMMTKALAAEWAKKRHYRQYPGARIFCQ